MRSLALLRVVQLVLLLVVILMSPAGGDPSTPHGTLLTLSAGTL